jgi:hypothetical protein
LTRETIYAGHLNITTVYKSTNKNRKKKYYLYLNSAARGVDKTTAQARSNFDSEVQDLIIPVNG